MKYILFRTSAVHLYTDSNTVTYYVTRYTVAVILLCKAADLWCQFFFPVGVGVGISKYASIIHVSVLGLQEDVNTASNNTVILYHAHYLSSSKNTHVV